MGSRGVITQDQYETFRDNINTLIQEYREINIKDQILTIREDVETVYEKTVTPFGNSGKVDVAKKYIGKRVYVIVLRK